MKKDGIAESGVDFGIDFGIDFTHKIHYSGHRKKRTDKFHKWLICALFYLAERVGFEPTRPFGLTDFESAPL